MSRSAEGVALRRRAYRLALAVTLGLSIESLRGSPLPMLAPVIALQLLAASPLPPPGRVIVGLLAISAGSAGVAYFISTSVVGIPGVYGLGVGLLYIWGFSLAFVPKTRMIGTMMVTMTVVITALTAASTGLALGVMIEIIQSVLYGIFLVIFAHVVFPHPGGVAVPQPSAEHEDAIAMSPVTRAVLATVVILPLHLYLTSDGVAAMVILLTTATMLRQPGIAQSTRYGAAFAMGNGLGGVLAGVSVFATNLHGDLAVLVSVTAATSLYFATRLVGSERWAPVFLPGFVAYTTLFGLVLSSLPLGDNVDVVKRVLQIVFAAVYALAAVSLLVPVLRWLNRPARSGA